MDNPLPAFGSPRPAATGLAAFKDKLTTLVNADRAVDAFGDGAPAQEGAVRRVLDDLHCWSQRDRRVRHRQIRRVHPRHRAQPQRMLLHFGRHGACLLEDAAIAPETTANAIAEIRLFRTDPGAGTGSAFLARIPLDRKAIEQRACTSLDNALQVLLSTAWWGAFGARLIEPGYWEANEVRLDTYDLTDPFATRAARSMVRGRESWFRRAGALTTFIWCRVIPPSLRA